MTKLAMPQVFATWAKNCSSTLKPPALSSMAGLGKGTMNRFGNPAGLSLAQIDSAQMSRYFLLALA